MSAVITARFVLLALTCLLREIRSVTETGWEDSATGPHFTACLSREQETFRCWWSSGTFQNISEPGALRVFFLKKNSRDWTECPQYSISVPNECFFNKNHTSIWTSYCVQLRSRDSGITYDERCFTVENIVHPDPPIGLNWTLLNVSQSRLHFDIIVRWEPPPSADVKGGWMTLMYELQYRERNTSHWIKMEQVSGTQQSVYGLLTGMEYEVRVRCTMRTFNNFGEFSASVPVHVPKEEPKESTYPLTVVFIFGAVGLAILLMLIIFSQQQRLMVILLPPIPAPKIKGIDSDMLKKGRLDELGSFLGAPPIYKPDVCPEEPYVEFIEVDTEEPEPVEKESSSDTQRLLTLDSSNTLALKDDDEPEQADPVPSVHTKLSGGCWLNMDFYAQVSDVTPAGGVVLSPGQHSRQEVPKKAQDHEREKEKQKVQMLIVPPEVGAYTSETDARHMGNTANPPTQPQVEKNTTREHQGAYRLPPAAPVSDYTVVQDVDAQHSLLLNPATLSCPAPYKPPPPMPNGYLAPDLLGSLSL